tara:strand:+ start:34 stop:156 length:123 start_codon:yes stop_codon:yes gene_type:complete
LKIFIPDAEYKYNITGIAKDINKNIENNLVERLFLNNKKG